MKTKFTPGPWNRNKAGFIYAPDGENHIVKVAEVGDFSDKDLLPFNKDRWSADANLIAAAPEMFEALEKLIRNPQEPDLFEIGKALRKARGEK